MNNIELNQLKRDMIKYLKYSQEQVDNIGTISDKKVRNLKKEIESIKKTKTKKNKVSLLNFRKLDHRIRLEKKIRDYKLNQEERKKIELDGDRKPAILIITDVKGWAWWLKSQYIKEHLSDEFDIDIKCVIGEGCIPPHKIDQNSYDLYFTYGFSYIDLLYRVPRNRKVTGVTAHRRKNVIFPKMKMAGHHHANSKMLLNELHDMGFTNAYYLPNGVDADLFKPIVPIKKDGDLIVGHVGKECQAKGQREYILPAIKAAECKSFTNLRTWQDKLPHKEMPNLYNQMDVFVVASVEDGTPNPALEAAACGRPIISNHIGNMPELIKDGYNGFIVPRKIGAYVEKIKYFKENRDELIRMGENARKSILAEWTWKHQSERYRSMFKDIFDMK
jgi:glycosyltransferase involved in cell wall biosynthesis